jgi:hypothetical protein
LGATLSIVRTRCDVSASDHQRYKRPEVICWDITDDTANSSTTAAIRMLYILQNENTDGRAKIGRRTSLDAAEWGSRVAEWGSRVGQQSGAHQGQPPERGKRKQGKQEE